MQIEEINPNVTVLTFSDGKKLTIVGSAHISQESIEDVKEQIDSINPDSICIELDTNRWDKYHENSSQEKAFADFDLVKVIKDGKFFLLIVNLILSTFQKRMSKNTTQGKVGMEIIGAGEIANERGIPLTFADRNVATTLKRAWKKSSLWTKAKLIALLLGSVFDRSELREDEIAKLKNGDNITKMLEELGKELPSVKEVLIDERDKYLASKIYNAPGVNKFAVVGKGHVSGLIKTLSEIDNPDINLTIDTNELEIVETKKFSIKSYIIPAILIIFLMTIGIIKGAEKGAEYFLLWAVCNALTSAFGAIITLSHPLTWLVTAITAPIAALAPILGVGMFSAVTEASLRRARVKDIDNIQDDLVKPLMWFKNRVLHAFLVFVFTSILSGVGTFIVFPILLAHFS